LECIGYEIIMNLAIVNVKPKSLGTEKAQYMYVIVGSINGKETKTIISKTEIRLTAVPSSPETCAAVTLKMSTFSVNF